MVSRVPLEVREALVCAVCLLLYARDVRKVAVAMHFAAFNGMGTQYKLARGFYTGAAQQALLGTNWNDAIDVLELGLDALEEEGRSAEMEAAIGALPAGAKVP